jgi:PPOX class probable F420-dependent enzyme
MHPDVPIGELTRHRTELVLERGTPLVIDEGGAQDPDDDDREREAHIGRIGNKPGLDEGRRLQVTSTAEKPDEEAPMSKLSEKQLEFLEHPFVGVVTTLREDGSPHSTVVWVDVEDGIPMFNTALGRKKPSNLQKDPRASLLVIDPQDAYKWVAVDGKVELTSDGADPQIDKLAKKYLGQDEYPWRKEGEERVTVKISPERVSSSGLEG